MAAWATQECRCGHPRFRHGEPRFSGTCGACLCGFFEMPPPAPDVQGPPPPPPPEPDRTPIRAALSRIRTASGCTTSPDGFSCGPLLWTSPEHPEKRAVVTSYPLANGYSGDHGNGHPTPGVPVSRTGGT